MAECHSALTGSWTHSLCHHPDIASRDVLWAVTSSQICTLTFYILNTSTPPSHFHPCVHTLCISHEAVQTLHLSVGTAWAKAQSSAHVPVSHDNGTLIQLKQNKSETKAAKWKTVLSKYPHVQYERQSSKKSQFTELCQCHLRNIRFRNKNFFLFIILTFHHLITSTV